ncbi:MAG: hexameric tyrosine-coordinated heme protein [Casimicrobiaceae bacterium]
MIDTWLKSLKTSTPQGGFELAIKLSQMGVKYTQPSADIRNEVRPTYEKNADNLIAASQVIATHFRTISMANDYWQE